jgi:hypothetical protein
MTIVLAALVTQLSSADQLDAAGAPGPPDGAVPIRLNLEPGSTYYQRWVIEQRVVVDLEEGERITNSTFGTGLKYEVLHRDDAGVHRMRVTYDWVRIQTQQGNEGMSYDSAKSIEPESPRAVLYAAQVGQSYEFTIAADGTILAFEGVSAMHDRMAQRITELGGPGQRYLPTIREQFGEESLQDGFRLHASVLPKGDVRIGDTWSTSTTNTAGIPRVLSAQYRLVRIEEGKAVIEMDTSIRPPKQSDDEGSNRRDRQWIEASGRDRGFYRVDLATGWLVDGETEQTMAGTTHARRGGQESVADIEITGTTRHSSSKAAPSED